MIQYYYPQTIKGCVVALMDLFNDLKVYKYDSSGTSADSYPVFFTFGPVQKYHQDRIEDHYFDTSATDLSGYTQVEQQGRKYFLSTPRMALTLESITYDPDRAYGVNEWRYWLQQSLDLTATDLERIFSDYQPTPYNLNFNLAIMTNSMDYFAQIMENILPYFNPKLYLRVKEFSFLNIDRDLPVSIGGIPLEFSRDMGETDRREVNASLDLTVEAFLYRPWTYSQIIKVINTRYFMNTVVTTTSATSAFTSGSVLTETYSTSGYLTSGGVPLSASDIPTSYDFSGTYDDSEKEFNWYRNFSATDESG